MSLEDFSASFPLLISSLLTVVGEITVYNFNFCNFIEVYFMAQVMVYLGICSVDTSKNVFRYSCWVECSINVD